MVGKWSEFSNFREDLSLMQSILFENASLKWIDLENPTKEELEELGRVYQFNRFTLADNLEPGHLPKFESDVLISFLLVRFYGKDKHQHQNIVREFSHKIGVYFNENIVLTIHQKPTNLLVQAKEACLVKNRDHQKINSKLLLYYILRQTLLSYQLPGEKMMEKIDAFETIVFSDKSNKITLKKIFQLKREASSCKKILSLMDDVIKELTIFQKNPSQFQDLRESSQKYLHFYSQILDDIQNLIAIFMSLSNQKTNDIMKLLTIFSAFFLPLTFVVGVYGMNFDYMPELAYKYGYPICLIAMIAIVIFIYFWFKKKQIL